MLYDIRYAVRQMRKAPGFTLTAVLTLALGIGCTTAVFSIVNAVIVQPLRYGHPDRIVLVWSKNNRGFGNPSARAFQAFHDQSTAFEHLGAVTNDSFDLRSNPPVRLRAARATAEVFGVFDVAPQLGRVFTDQEARSGAHVVVLSHPVWVKDFASDPTVVGRTVSLNTEPWTVIGVMPDGFEFVRNDDVWVPLKLDSERQRSSILAVGLLNPGVSQGQAEAQLKTIAEGTARDFPDSEKELSAAVMSLKEFLLGPRARLMMWILLDAVFFVLLIACANISSLLLARGATRQKEIAVRSALGARRGRTVRELLVESFVLALIGAAVGVGLAYEVVGLLSGLSFLHAPGAAPVRIDGVVLAFIAGVTALVTIIFGLLPAWQTSRVDLVSSLKAISAATIGSAQHQRFRSAIVVAEITLCVVLLAGAGLLIRTFMNVASTSGGFRREGVLTAEITLSADRYKTNDSVRNFYEQALARVRALPGVESADISTTLPLMGWVAGVVFRLEGQANDSEHRSNANLQAISDSYFKTMGIPIVRGRAFGAVDTATSTRVAIIDQHLANRLFNDTDPIGKRIIRSGDPVLQVPDSVVQVVGVAADVKDEDLDAPAADDIYFPYEQSPIRWEYLEIRSGSDSAALLPSIRNAIASVDPDQPIEDVATMQQRLDESLGPRRFSMTLLVAFSAIALVLAAIGLYGVVSYAVAQRTREFGLRVALGASPEQVTKLVLRRGLFLAGVGAAIGVVLALAASRVMKAMLFGVSTADPLAFAAAVTVLISVALLAIYIPARRATKVDPMVALRYE